MNQSTYYCLLTVVIPLLVVQYSFYASPRSSPEKAAPFLTVPASGKMNASETNSLSIVPLEERGGQMQWEIDALRGMPFAKEILYPFDLNNAPTE